MRKSRYYEMIETEIKESQYARIKRVVTLRARNGSGKTSTIKQLCKALYAEYSDSWKGPKRYCPARIDITHGEIKRILVINGWRIAFLSAGDTAKIMIDHFKWCVAHEVDVIVMAVRSSEDGGVFSAECAFAKIKTHAKFQEEKVVMQKWETTTERNTEELRCVQVLHDEVVRLVKLSKH